MVERFLRTLEEECTRRIAVPLRRDGMQRDWPPGASCATPVAAIDGEPGRKVELVVHYHAGQRQLPVIQLKRVAWDAATALGKRTQQ